ncbi:hypothetical protein [Halostella pelagica]|uniref:hypothetical protein n=1 Tax=Halostella pelagica TaxID=2583824 RepID=UPI0010814328|nr:hypothetical protein [Halostella pelagica]
MDLVELSVVGTTIRGVDVSGNEVEVDLFGWDQPAPETEFERPVDAAVSGRTRQLVFPPWTHTWISELGDDEIPIEGQKFTNDQESISLDRGRYNVLFDLDMRVFVNFEGSATVHRDSANRTVLSFEHPTAVTVGLQSMTRYPTETVTVPRTTAGVATAISALSVSHPSGGVTVTSPMSRRHPPRVEFGDETAIPESVRESAPDTSVAIRVPDSIESLLPVAPLAYYLDAEVTIEERGSPILRAPDVDLTHEFEPMPTFQFEVADLLRRVFLLDTLVKFKHEGAGLSELDVLRSLPPDFDRVYRADIDERLRTYLSLPYERLEPVLPPWHYCAYLDPTVRNARLLPYVTAHMGQVMLSDAAPRSSEGARDRDTESFPFVGWADDDPPTNAFRARRQGFENALEYGVSAEDTARAVVVDNSSDSGSQADRLSDILRTCSTKSLEVSVASDLSTAELRDRFAASANLLHYVGEYDDGFVCADGTLAPDEIPESNVRIVFADANGSVEACDLLVQRGSAAVVGRYDDGETLDTAGREAFLKLLGGGAAVEQAAQYARRYGGSGTGPIVVGDGLTPFATMDGIYPIGYEIEPIDGHRFKVTGHPVLPDNGFLWSPDISDPAQKLVGTTLEFIVNASELQRLLANEQTFLILDDGVYSPHETSALYPIT